jgi:hypothetical protein
MARFDPLTYPNRLAFEANARRLRREEFDRLSGAAAAWLGRRREQAAGALARLVAGTGVKSPTHSHR